MDQLKQQPRPRLNPIEAMFREFNSKEKKAFLRTHRLQRMGMSVQMVQSPLPEDMQGQVLSSWKSRDYSCIVWPSAHPVVVCRLSINRMDLDPNTGSFLPGISWDTLYRIKNEVGYAAYDAIEVFPAEEKLVNVSNMRHLWVLAERLDFGL